MRSLPGSVPAPSAEVMKGSAPRWQVMRQHPPRASGAQHIADGIHHLPAGVFDGTAAGFGRRQQRFQQLPLPVVQVGGVIWSVHTPRLRHSARSSPSCHYASFYLFRHPVSITTTYRAKPGRGFTSPATEPLLSEARARKLPASKSAHQQPFDTNRRCNIRAYPKNWWELAGGVAGRRAGVASRLGQ